jgi:DNA repair protein RecN (Recombination protein N)
MLKSVNISNLAVISRLGIDFHSGLNLLTGETGAGKSILVDALGLLIGARASSDLVRTGEEAAVVEGVFDFDGETERLVRANLAEIGIAVDSEDYLTVRREVQVSGRNRVFINDKNVTLATLRSLQPFLIEIHGQGEQRSLFDPRAQLLLLDAFGACDALREEVRRLYLRRRDILRSIEASRRDVAERERLIELLRYQLEELGRFETYAGEKAELQQERHLLLHAEKVSELSGRAFGELYEEDDSVLTHLKSVRRRLQDLAAIDRRLAETLGSVENAELLLKDVAEELRHYSDGVVFNPGRLNQIETRLVEFERLERKYGCQADELIGMRQQLQKRLDELVNWGEHNAALQGEFAQASLEYAAQAKRLSACRGKFLPLLEEKVVANLKSLAMEQARFVIRMETAAEGVKETAEDVKEPVSSASDQAGAEREDDLYPRETFWSPFGADRLEFWLSANPGESLRPLSRVASGGELSRLMLILRTVSNRLEEGDREATLVFDEIDTGIGGRVAEAVGQRLKSLATNRQVFCVTHQPQIARFADHHFSVSKDVSAGRTETTVKELTGDERVEELARMIGGSKDVETAKDTARWLINSARENGAPAKDSKRRRKVK